MTPRVDPEESFMRSKAKATAMAAVAMALFAVVAEHLSTRLSAQSAAASSAIPNLTGIWHRKGPLNGKPNPPMAPTNSAVGYKGVRQPAIANV